MELVLIIFVLICGAVGVASDHFARADVMEQAFERGYAVQCIGMKGHYWECPK